MQATPIDTPHKPETDADREWLSKYNQVLQFGIPLPRRQRPTQDAMIAQWLQLYNE